MNKIGLVFLIGLVGVIAVTISLAGTPCGNEEWYAPGPSADKYYDCTSGSKVLMSCKPNTIWVQEKKWCDWGNAGAGSGGGGEGDGE